MYRFKGAWQRKMLFLICWWKHFAALPFSMAEQFEVCSLWAPEKNSIVWVCFLYSALSCDSTCLAPCCECSHWAVITHLTAVWNIHGQVSPSLQGSHMDSLLSPPPALIPCHFIPPAFCCTSQLLDTPHTATQCYCTILWLLDVFETRLSDKLETRVKILCYEFKLPVEIQGNTFYSYFTVKKELINWHIAKKFSSQIILYNAYRLFFTPTIQDAQYYRHGIGRY